MKPRSTAPSRATTYRGNGKFSIQAGGCMFTRPLNEDEKRYEEYIRFKYGMYLSDVELRAGTNMGRPCWVIRLEDGREVDTYESLNALEKEVLGLLDRNGIKL